MQWSDVTKAPSTRTLRQFAGLWLVVFGGLALWRAWHGQTGVWTDVLGAAAVIVGVAGLVMPAVVRPIYSGWMIAAFPIGWTVSKITLGGVFYLVFTPVAALFRIMGRDPLWLRRGRRETYWTAKATARSGEEYFRQF
jgi:protein-S-isoprenylcysteine O-methyltransferase Ste14